MDRRYRAGRGGDEPSASSGDRLEAATKAGGGDDEVEPAKLVHIDSFVAATARHSPTPVDDGLSVPGGLHPRHPDLARLPLIFARPPIYGQTGDPDEAASLAVLRPRATGEGGGVSIDAAGAINPWAIAKPVEPVAETEEADGKSERERRREKQRDRNRKRSKGGSSSRKRGRASKPVAVMTPLKEG